MTIGTDRSAQGTSAISPYTILNGGMIVYAVRDDGYKTAITLLDESVQLSISLDNGNYIFYAFGWDTGSLAASAPRCAISTQTSLQGNPVTVTLAMSPGACYGTGNTNFAPAAAHSGGTGAILPLRFSFCSNNASLSGVSAGGSCPSGYESANFMKGSSGTNAGEGDYVSSLNRVVFAGAIATATLPELHQYDFSTQLQKKISPAMVSGSHGVQCVGWIPGTTRVLYTADQNTVSVYELFMLDLSNGTNTKISQASPVSGSHGVQSFRIGYLSANNYYVVYAADMDTANTYELYSIAVSGLGPYTQTKISGTMASGAAGIYNCACSGNSSWRFGLSTDVRPDNNTGTANTSNPYVVYVADQATAGKKEVFIASLNGAALPGSTATGTKISSSEIATTSDFANEITFTYNAQYVAYRANSSSYDGVYYVKFNTGAAPSAPAAACYAGGGSNCNLVYPYFAVSNASQKIAYAWKYQALYPSIAVIDLNSPGTLNYGIMQSAGGTAEQMIGKMQFTPDDSAVISVTQNNLSQTKILRSTTTNPTNHFTGVTNVTLSGTMPSGGYIRPASPGNSDYFMITSDSSKVLYQADQNTLGKVELFYATIGSATSFVPISGTVAAAANSVASYGIVNSTVLMAAALNTANFNELYTTALTASPTITRLNSGNVSGSILSIDSGAKILTNKLMYKAVPIAGGANSERYTFDVTTSVFDRVIRLYNGSQGLGRFQVSALNYLFSPSGQGVYQTSPLFQSACMPLGAGDGQSFSTAIKLPLGNGTNLSPFSVAIDVYPLGTACTGTSVRYLFPNGLAYGSSVPNSTKVVGDSSTMLGVFLNDL